MACATTLRIDPGHPALAGHFPGAPVLPGVVLLDETVRILEQANAAAQTRWIVAAAKFLKPVLPGETLILEYAPLPNGSMRFAVSSGGRPVANGVLRPADAPRGAARAARAAAAAGPPGEPRTSDAHWAG
ncbi:MAG TPA: hypothetical protein VKQ31_02690, partial [Steroidobacteraceae bacterium]|nr:hypothetical protein [Steroidobacteraceae bacterium]